MVRWSLGRRCRWRRASRRSSRGSVNSRCCSRRRGRCGPHILRLREGRGRRCRPRYRVRLPRPLSRATRRSATPSSPRDRGGPDLEHEEKDDRKESRVSGLHGHPTRPKEVNDVPRHPHRDRGVRSSRPRRNRRGGGPAGGQLPGPRTDGRSSRRSRRTTPARTPSGSPRRSTSTASQRASSPPFTARSSATRTRSRATARSSEAAPTATPADRRRRGAALHPRHAGPGRERVEDDHRGGADQGAGRERAVGRHEDRPVSSALLEEGAERALHHVPRCPRPPHDASRRHGCSDDPSVPAGGRRRGHRDDPGPRELRYSNTAYGLVRVLLPFVLSRAELQSSSDSRGPTAIATPRS